MTDELATKSQFKPTPKLFGLAAKKAAEKAKLVQAGETIVIEPTEMKHRIGIVFDDSSSMGDKQIQDAIAGVEEFLRSCVAGETAVAIQPMNAGGLALNSNLPAVAVFTQRMRATGGTPLVLKLTDMLQANPLTRAIVFSDGQPNSYSLEQYKKLIGFERPVDTVYIPSGYINEEAEAFMRKLAEDTGGIYLRLESGKSNFRTAFKYLSPGLRYMLADKSFVTKLEGR
jgi:hypothetical protein